MHLVHKVLKGLITVSPIRLTPSLVLSINAIPKGIFCIGKSLFCDTSIQVF